MTLNMLNSRRQAFLKHEPPETVSLGVRLWDEHKCTNACGARRIVVHKL
jgi:hypothetical protein